MSSRELYRTIGYIPNRRNCKYKKRYDRWEDAMEVAVEHERRYICSGMDAYRCRLHSCWHVGHRDKRRRARLALIEHVEWFEVWARRN